VLQEEYTKLVEGEVLRPPTRIERLIRTANGHPNKEATQAARGLLDKSGIDWQSKFEFV
jgi:hypothetical protein